MILSFKDLVRLTDRWFLRHQQGASWVALPYRSCWSLQSLASGDFPIAGNFGRWVVDSTAVISKVEMAMRLGARPWSQPNNVDFLSMISALYKELRRPINITWVKGHQDLDTTKSKNLSRNALNNTAVNKVATQHCLQKKLLPK